MWALTTMYLANQACHEGSIVSVCTYNGLVKCPMGGWVVIESDLDAFCCSWNISVRYGHDLNRHCGLNQPNAGFTNLGAEEIIFVETAVYEKEDSENTFSRLVAYT